MTSSCFLVFLLQRKSLRDQWLMEGAPLSPTSSDTQSLRSPLWGSEAQEMEEHIDQYSCGWVFFPPNNGAHLWMFHNHYERDRINGVCLCLCVFLCVFLKGYSQRVNIWLRKRRRNLWRTGKWWGTCTDALVLLFFGQERGWKMCWTHLLQHPACPSGVFPWILHYPPKVPLM